MRDVIIHLEEPGRDPWREAYIRDRAKADILAAELERRLDRLGAVYADDGLVTYRRRNIIRAKV